MCPAGGLVKGYISIYSETREEEMGPVLNIVISFFSAKRKTMSDTHKRNFMYTLRLTFKVAACRRVNVRGDAMIVSTKKSAPF